MASDTNLTLEIGADLRFWFWPAFYALYALKGLATLVYWPAAHWINCKGGDFLARHGVKITVGPTS